MEHKKKHGIKKFDKKSFRKDENTEKLPKKGKKFDKKEPKKAHNKKKRTIVPLLIKKPKKIMKEKPEKPAKIIPIYPKNPPWSPIYFNQNTNENQSNLKNTAKLSQICKNLSYEENPINFYKSHTGSITSLDVSENTVITGSKDCNICIYDLEKGITGKLKGDRGNMQTRGHFSDIFGVAISKDGKYAVSGGQDKFLRIWDIQNMKQIYYFEGHQSSITVFLSENNLIYSVSYDKTMKIWDLTKGQCLDTLQSHTGEILSLDVMSPKTVLTSGTDGHTFLWKLAEENLLVYNSTGTIIDNVYSVIQEIFLTSCEDSTIELWTPNKNKPIFSLPKCHNSNFCSSLCGIKGTDILASGSTDGVVNLYKVSENSLETHGKLKVNGSVNAMKFAKNGEIFVCAQSVDQKFGRWITQTSVPIGINIFRVKNTNQ